ncbi:MAG: cysteine--1-D-myo-inosityl 2-amino-2-deoxy-alpha-D-glucopyranoside ligase [Dermatophilaceae bacterium]
MISWPSPFIPAVPGQGFAVQVHDTATDALVELDPSPVAGMYVCGITPYDATHIGHAATYVTFDVLLRTLRDCGHEVRYVQNVTDVDDPLLARAVRDKVDWTHLAAQETALYREDMTSLGVVAPDRFLGVTESIDLIVAAVDRLVTTGAAYRLAAGDAPGSDVYLDLAGQPGFGSVSGATRAQMLALSAQRGGDPERPGKRDALDPLLWRATRPGEPSWDGGLLGGGRPGWHIECTSIALEYLGMPFTVQGGGSDLVFPHHEMTAVQGCALTGADRFADAYVHQAMVGLDGAKMSKSRGNLVLVSQLRRGGVDPMAIRLVLLGHHYRKEWDWTDAELARAAQRLDTWRAAFSVNAGPDAGPTVAAVRRALSHDLDTPAALAAVDAWVDRSLADGGTSASAPGLLARAVDALLGIRL